MVLSCTASTLPLIGLGMVERAIRQRRHRPMLMIDLAVPARHRSSRSSRLDDVFLYTVDDLRELVQTGQQGRRAAVTQAEAIIDTQVHSFMQWLSQRQVVPMIQDLHARGDALRQAELEKARRMLARGEDPQKVLEAMSHGADQQVPARLHHADQPAGLQDPKLASLLSELLPPAAQVKPSLQNRLARMQARLEEVNAALSSEDAARDLKLLRRLNQEHTEISEVLDHFDA